MMPSNQATGTPDSLQRMRGFARQVVIPLMVSVAVISYAQFVWTILEISIYGY